MLHAPAARSVTSLPATQSTPRVADILAQYGGDFVRQYPSQAPRQVRSVLSKLLHCRTPELGDHLYRCDQCDHQCRVYNSCGDRHCPQCSGAKRADWLDSTTSLLLPEIPYFQVVFTIPDQLSSLTLGNRREMFNLLFQAAWDSLKDTIETEQQFEAAAAMILHTWKATAAADRQGG